MSAIRDVRSAPTTEAHVVARTRPGLETRVLIGPRPGNRPDIIESFLSGLGDSSSIEEVHVDKELLHGINPHFLAENRVLPLFRLGQKLFFVHSGPIGPEVQHLLRQITNSSMLRGEPMEADSFQRLLHRVFPNLAETPASSPSDLPASPVGAQAADPMALPAAAPDEFVAPVAAPAQDVVDNHEDPIIVRAVNTIIRSGLERGATDIHIEPAHHDLRIRYRIDGVLVEVCRYPDFHARSIASRIKVLAGMKSFVNFLPQSGRLTVTHAGAPHELRVSILPTIYGEALVLRVLPEGGAETTLEQRGLSGGVLQRFRTLIRRSSGIILVTGPTGSGKSSTLYSALHEISSPEIKVITLEDPVEYKLPGLIQSTIDSSRGYDFEAGLREILRHDPEVILVGEIRDRQTAEIAVQASLTGHLVLSTLHTIDAPSAVTRLLDMGVQVYRVEASLLCVIAQRLARVVCPACAQEVRVKEDAFAPLDIPVPADEYVVARAAGCDACLGTGYRGRTGIYELMVVDDVVRASMRSSNGIAEIRAAAVRGGMVPLVRAGLELVLKKTTTIEELASVCV